MGFARHFFPPEATRLRQEVNVTWYPEIEEPIKSHEKHYSLVLYILICEMHGMVKENAIMCKYQSSWPLFLVHNYERVTVNSRYGHMSSCDTAPAALEQVFLCDQKKIFSELHTRRRNNK